MRGNTIVKSIMEVKPEEPIGIIVAQQCSAPAVQTSLSAFHQVGTSHTQKVSLGTEYSDYLRLQTKIEDSTSYIYPKQGYTVKQLYDEIQHVCLQDLVETYSIISSVYLEKYRKYHDVPYSISHAPRCLSLVLKKDKMFYYKINPVEVKYIIESNVYDVTVVPSPLKDHTIEIICSSDNAEKLLNLCQGLFDSTEKTNTSLRNLQLKGIANIWPENIVGDEYIKCRGCNIQAMFDHEMIDNTRSFSNNIKETYKYYGNIATRGMIKKHLKLMFNNDVDDKAMDILIGNMMYKGYPIPVTQEGTNLQNRSLVFKMTYEHFMEHAHDIPFIGVSPVVSVYDKIAVGKI